MPRLKPRIVHVLPWQLCLGGAQRFIADLCAWARDWAETHLVYLQPGSDSYWVPALDGVSLHPAESPDQATGIVSDLTPDLIHHHYPESDWGIRGLVGKYPLLGTPHGWDGNLHHPEWAIPVCGPRAQIRHGIDLDHYCPGPRPKPDGRYHVGIVGRLREDKVPLFFLSALRAWLPLQRGQVVIHFIGRGLDDRAGRRVQQAAAAIRGVRLHGDIPPDQMPGIYRQLDAVLIPSRRDSVSLVALEAMACGIPVIVRAIEGLPETVGDAGLVCKDDQALLAAIGSLRRNSQLCRQLSAKGREHARSLYDRRRMLAQYGDAYRRFTGGLVRPPESTVDVTVVMPVADGIHPDWLHQAIHSVWAQSGVCFELIIIDDGITDVALRRALAQYDAGDANLRILHRPIRGGISAAINEGIRAARSDLIARADADDIMPAGRLAEQVAFMRANPGVALLCGDMKRLTPTGLADLPRGDLRDGLPLWDYWIGNWPIAHPTVMYRRYPVLALGGYDESLPRAEDLDLWCRLHAAGYRFVKQPKIWNHYRTHDGQATASPDLVRHWTREVLNRYRGERASA